MSGTTCRHVHLGSCKGSLRIRMLLCCRRHLLRLGIQRRDDCVLHSASMTLTLIRYLPWSFAGLVWHTSLLSNSQSGTAHAIFAQQAVICCIQRKASMLLAVPSADTGHGSSGYARSSQGVTAYFLGSCGGQLLSQRLLVLRRLSHGCVSGLQGSLCVHMANMQCLVGRLQRLEVRRSLAQQLCMQRTSAQSGCLLNAKNGILKILGLIDLIPRLL